ncbi:hypothetical protein SFRURICE_012912 [Spodoptera frugiperda]|nr:hypothetical protein SFRURICE_012912 [Spodoptera frugiperda]
MDPALAVEMEALSRQKAMFEATERGDSTVQQFYKDSTVFLTGASGFLGKQLVEKLFRACNIRKIFILLRPKKNMTIQERLEEMSFVYVSTTYSTATQANVDKEVMERFYPCPLPPELMVDMAENIDDERMDAIEANLIKGYPNTYTFTKSIAEEVVRSRAGDMPTCIIRPAVVISSYREPVPGWADASCAFGASGVKPISSKIRDIGKVLPTPLAVWYTFIVNTSNKPLFFLLTWLLHYIPGYILDACCILLGKPTMFIKLYNRVNRSSLALSYFTTHTWVFNDTNSDKLFNSLSKTDRLIFNFDTTDINIPEFVTLWCVGLRKYLMKDGIKNTEYAKRKQVLLKYLHYVVSCLYVYVLFKVACFVCYLILCLFGIV